MTAKLKTHRLPLGEPSAKRPATALLVTLALLGWSCISAPSPPEYADATLAIVDVTVIDGTGAPPQTGRTLLVRDSIVIGIVDASTVRLSSEAVVIKSKGRFLIPGLWDMHTHIWDESLLPIYVANGITGVRDMGSVLEPWADWRQRAAAGELIAPRSFVAGQIVDALEPLYFGWAQVSSPEEARAKVSDLASRGADFIKVYDRLPREVYFAVIDEAKEKGLRVAGHVPVEVPVSEAVLAGHHSVEHLIGIALESSSEEHAFRERAAAAAASLRESKISREEAPRILGRFYDLLRYEPLESADPEKAAHLYSLLAESQGWQVPTLVVRRPATDSLREQLERGLGCFPPFMRQLVLPQNAGGEAAEVRIRERHEAAIAIVREMHRAGVPLLAGSDGGNPSSLPAFSLHDELEIFVDAGLTPLEALQTATRNAAESLGREDTGGTIEPGKIADLVLLEADPLADIRNTRRIEAVVMDGRLLPRSEIISILSACAAAPEDRTVRNVSP